MKKFTGILLCSLSIPLSATADETLENLQEECFAKSMIGYDYVINSRVGLPIEKALNTVTINSDSNLIRDTYKYHLKKVVTNAYAWQDTPHTYAVKVMFECAFSHGVNHSST